MSKWKVYTGFGVEVRNFAPGYLLAVVSGESLLVEHNNGSFIVKPGESIFALKGGDCRISSEKNASFIPLNDLPWQGYDRRGYSISEPPELALQVNVGEPDSEQSQPTIVAGLAFVLRGGGVASFANQLPRFIHLKRSLQQANQLTLDAVDFLMNDKQPGYFAAAVQLAEFTLTNALRDYVLNQDSFPVGVLRGLSHARLGKAMQYVAASYADPMNLKSLADIAGMSRSVFAETFAANIGETPMAYVNRIRVEKAAELLAQTPRKIEDIAQSCGFRSDRSMRFAFKRVLGKTPKAFRNTSGL